MASPMSTIIENQLAVCQERRAWETTLTAELQRKHRQTMWTDDRVFSGRALNEYVDGSIFPAGLIQRFQKRGKKQLRVLFIGLVLITHEKPGSHDGASAGKRRLWYPGSCKPYALHISHCSSVRTVIIFSLAIIQYSFQPCSPFWTVLETIPTHWVLSE